MKQTVKMFVQYNLTTGEWVGVAGQPKAQKAGALSLSAEEYIDKDIDHQRWYGIKANVMEMDVVIDVPDDILLPIIKEAGEESAEIVKKQMKELEAKFFMQKTALENQLKGILAIGHHPGDDAKEVNASVSEDTGATGDFIPAANTDSHRGGDDSGQQRSGRHTEEAEDADYIDTGAKDDPFLDIPF